MLLHLRWFPPRSTAGSTFRFAFFLFRDYSTPSLSLLLLFPFLFNYVALTDHQLLRPLSSLFSLLLRFPPSAFSLLSSPLSSRSLCFRSTCLLATLFYQTYQRHDVVRRTNTLPTSRRG